MKTKTVNVLGDTQRQQWHSVVHMIRTTGQLMSQEGLSAICGELDRYIDFCEDIFDEMREEDA